MARFMARRKENLVAKPVLSGVPADAVELGGQDMQQEPAHELGGIERIVLCRVLPWAR